MFGALLSQRKSDDLVGVEFHADGLALVHLQNYRSAVPTLQNCEFITCDAESDHAAILSARISDLGLQKIPCRFVLSRKNYQFLLVEAPKVPADELNEALRWRIKDLLNFPADNAVIDSFLLPQDSARTPMAYVAVAENSVIRAVVDAVKAANLVLQSIEIPELSLRNLAIRAADTTRGLAIVQLVQGGGALQVICDKQLYLSRRFELNYNGGLLDDLPQEALTLELQRSLDYYERQMRQVPPKQLLFCGENISADKLTAGFKKSLSASALLLDIEQQLVVRDEVQKQLLPLCLLALGAALVDSSEGHNLSEAVANAS